MCHYVSRDFTLLEAQFLVSCQVAAPEARYEVGYLGSASSLEKCASYGLRESHVVSMVLLPSPFYLTYGRNTSWMNELRRAVFALALALLSAASAQGESGYASIVSVLPYNVLPLCFLVPFFAASATDAVLRFLPAALCAPLPAHSRQPQGSHLKIVLSHRGTK